MSNPKNVAVETEHLLLTPAEKADPLQVVHEFFDFSHLPQARELLWKWFTATVTEGFSSSLTYVEKANLVSFYERLEKLVEAAHLLHKANK